MKKVVSLLIIPLFIFLWACSEGEQQKTLSDAEPIVLRSDLHPRIGQDNTFAWNLFKNIYQSTEEPNVFISPLSISMALGMTMNGAKGETWEEMAKALSISGFTSDEINEYSKTLREALLKVDSSTQLSIANSIWYRWGFPVENNFKQINQNYFNAAIKEADFADPSTVLLINKWCGDNTKGRIPEIINAISEDVIMYLINAVYFKGIWKFQFDKNNSHPELFHADNGQESQVHMMRQTGKFNYTADDYAQYLELPYGNNAFSMIVMLPNDGKSVHNVMDNLNIETWNSAIANLQETKVNLKLPRFKIESKHSIKKNLQQMGMDLPFSAFADFTGISRGGGINISEVLHKTFVEVNEEGTEAAAVTAVVMVANASQETPSVNFVVDKPFLFAIKEKSTGVILFMGKIGKI